jgi:hypothetical protein
MSNYFHDEKLHLLDYAQSRGRSVKGEEQVLQVDAKPSITPAFGSMVTFSVDTNGDQFLDDARLVTEISPITGTGGTYIRACNAVGLHMWDRFELKQNGDLLRTRTADDVWADIKYDTDSDRYARISQDIGVAAITDRNTFAASAQTFALSCKRIFGEFSTALDRNIMKGKLEILGYLKRDVKFVIQTDQTTPTFAITNCYADLLYVKPKTALINLSRQMYVDNKNMGEPRFVIATVDVHTTINSGATYAVINLPELQDKDVIDIKPIIRLQSLMNTNSTSDYTDTYIAPISWALIQQ